MSMTNCDICGIEWKYHGTACSSGGNAHSLQRPCYASGVDEIESEGVVVGCDSTERTITIKISTRPSGVRIGDDCSLKWKRHPLTHNDKSSNPASPT